MTATELTAPAPLGEAGAPDSLRILIACSSFPPNGWGGAEVAAEGIANWLSSRGHAVGLYTDAEKPASGASTGDHPVAWYHPQRAEWSHRAYEHHGQSAPKKALWHLMDHLPRRGFADFRETVAAFKPDLVMVHLAPGLGLGLFEYCAQHDLPLLFVVHDFWMACLRSSLFSKAGQVCVKRELACRWSSSVRWGALSKVRRLGFWAPSRSIVDILESELGQVLPNVLVERNVIDLNDFSVLPLLPPGPRIRFLYVGKITEAKGVAFLLDCLAGLPRTLDFEIELVGGGDLEAHLRERYRSDPRVAFAGIRNRAEVAQSYQRASVLLVPSLWFENSPIVVYQAQAAGLPVVGSRSGGIPELLGGRDDSVVLPAGDRAAWTECLRELAVCPARVAAMREAATRRARDGGEALHRRGLRVVELCRALIGPKPA